MAFNWLELPQLITPRLTLRTIAPADLEALFAIYGDPAVMEFASDPPYKDRAQIAQLQTSIKNLWAERVSIEWGIDLNDRLIGTAGLHSFSADRTQAEIGCLLARAQWGQGLMTEALTAVIVFGFQILELQTILAEVDVRNERSLALFKRLGFHRELLLSEAPISPETEVLFSRSRSQQSLTEPPFL